MNRIKYEPEIVAAAEAPKPMPAPSPGMTMPAFPAQTSLAMAYVPFQKWENVYTVEVGFGRGTIFADLDKPFIGEVGKQ